MTEEPEQTQDLHAEVEALRAELAQQKSRPSWTSVWRPVVSGILLAVVVLLAPLCVVAHSLGTVIASNYLYDLMKRRGSFMGTRVRGQINGTPLERGETRERLGDDLVDPVVRGSIPRRRLVGDRVGPEVDHEVPKAAESEGAWRADPIPELGLRTLEHGAPVHLFEHEMRRGLAFRLAGAWGERAHEGTAHRLGVTGLGASDSM